MISGLGVGILSWRAHETLRRTLESYRARGLADLTEERAVFFNEISDADRALAAEFGFEARGDRRNLGLLEGTGALAESLRSDCLLLLQNDCPLCVSREETERYLSAAVQLLEDGRADIVRCRHRWNVGEGFSDIGNYLKYWKPEGAGRGLGARTLRGGLRPFKAHRMIGRSPYVLRRPDLRHPGLVRREGDFYIVDSSVINFTDQPFLIRKSFFMKLLDYAKTHPSHRTLNGFQVVEICLNCSWWRRQHFRIAVGEGCFTHNRFDDSFRHNHIAFNGEIVNSGGCSC